MVVKVISHECGNEVIGVVIVLLHPHHHWHSTLGTRTHQVVWQKLTLTKEIVCLSLETVMKN